LGIGLKLIGAQVTILCSRVSFPLLKSESSAAGMSEISIESIEESWDLGLDGPYCARPENERRKQDLHFIENLRNLIT